MAPEDKGDKRPAVSMGLVAMLGGAFLFSVMALLVKYLAEFGSYELVFWRSLFMLMGTTTALLVKGIDLRGPEGMRLLLTVRGVAGFGFMVGYYYAIKHLPLSDAVVINYTSPVLSAIAAAVLLGEPWENLDMLGSVLCMVGVVLVSKPSFVMEFFGAKVEPLPLDGVLGAVIAAVLSTAVYLMVRMLKGVHPLVFVHYFAATGAILGPIGSYLHGETWVWPQGSAWGLLVLLAAISIIGQALMNIGLTLETAAKATAMNYSQVAFAFIFQATLLGQKAELLSTLGSALIASWGVVALVKEARAKKPTATNSMAKKLLASEEGDTA